MTDNNKKTHLIVTGRGGGGTQVQADWNQTDSEQPDYIKNKPELATVATTGDYDDLTNKPTIPEAPVQSDWSQTDSTALDYIKNKPSIPSGQVNSDWNSNSGVSQILNKPSLATVATSGNYSDLNGTPTLATVATSGDYDDLQNKPTIPVVPTNVSAFTNDAGYTTFDGDYNSLTNKPTIPAAQVNSDWNASTGVSQILNKPSLATVATSGNYSDLNGTPSLATVATSGDYDDLQNKPTIPAAPVQSDWNEADSSSLAYIANKPTIPAAQVNSDWNANSGVAQILNKPTIPTVPAMATETLTFTLQSGTTKTIEFYTVPNYFYIEDISGSDNTLSIVKDGANAPTIEVFKSTDKVNWTSMGTTDTTAITATIPANSKLYLKATTNTWYNNKHNTITVSGQHNVGGNIMSLLYGDNFGGKTTFPATNSSLKRLFYNNYNLKGSNKLELAATTLVNGCYKQMFYGCYQMTTAPVLPATTLAEWCYQEMFYFCSALTTAPVLPATTLPTGCYAYMFNYCGSLNRIETYANTKQNNSLEYWLQNASATGDFYNLGSVTYPSGASGIPNGWTVHTSL